MPLAESLRPRSFEEVVGQQHLLGEQGFITRVVRSKKPLSLLFWGPPGSGKTTIAKLYAQAFNATFIPFQAVLSGIADLRKILSDIQEKPLLYRQPIVFIDEIHRLNKAQQDAFLPYVENGTFVLVGSTTENPSFSINNALLSRLRVLILNPLDDAALEQLWLRYCAKRKALPITKEGLEFLYTLSQGDGRYLLNLLESLESWDVPLMDPPFLQKALSKRAALYDRTGEGHYGLISALHKAVRGSDVDAALYWLARMLEGGEDPLFLCRRIIRMASEDVGLADPAALVQAIHARDAYEMLGSPEGELSIAQAVVYIATAPKSNALYTAWSAAKDCAAHTTHLSAPPHALNAPTKMMKALGYSLGYLYDHDTEEGCAGQDYFPKEILRPIWYKPVARGFEREMQKRVAYFSSFRQKRKYTGEVIMPQKDPPPNSTVTQEECTYQAGSTTLYGTLHRPANTSKDMKRPGLILFPAWRGKDAFAEEKAHLLAEQGYVVLAADPYGEKSPATDDKESERRMAPLFLNRPLLQSRAKAAFDTLCRQPFVDATKIGALGFCFGGLTVLELLRLGVPINGIISFHGVLSDRYGDKDAQIGVRNNELAGRCALFLHGNDDPLVSQEDLTALRQYLTDSKVEWTLTIYGRTSHAFMNPIAANPTAGLVYNPTVAKQAWRAALEFFHVLFDATNLK